MISSNPHILMFAAARCSLKPLLWDQCLAQGCSVRNHKNMMGYVWNGLVRTKGMHIAHIATFPLASCILTAVLHVFLWTWSSVAAKNAEVLPHAPKVGDDQSWTHETAGWGARIGVAPAAAWHCWFGKGLADWHNQKLSRGDFKRWAQ